MDRNIGQPNDWHFDKRLAMALAIFGATCLFVYAGGGKAIDRMINGDAPKPTPAQIAHEAVAKSQPDKTVFFARKGDGSESNKVVCETTGDMTPKMAVKLHDYERNVVFECKLPEIGAETAK